MEELFYGIIKKSGKKSNIRRERKMGGEKGGIDEEKEISGDEIKRAMKKLRDGKANRIRWNTRGGMEVWGGGWRDG